LVLAVNAEVIKDATAEKGLQQQDVAQYVGVTNGTISQFLNLGKTPGIRTGFAIARLLGLDINLRSLMSPAEEQTTRSKTQHTAHMQT
jgi:transcriptional regulator with XRE-family HTH domain